MGLWSTLGGLAGGAIGSIIPGIGTGAGAALGGSLGGALGGALGGGGGGGIRTPGFAGPTSPDWANTLIRGLGGSNGNAGNTTGNSFLDELLAGAGGALGGAVGGPVGGALGGAAGSAIGDYFSQDGARNGQARNGQIPTGQYNPFQFLASMDAVVQPMMRQTRKAPPGYVLVTRQGVTLAVLKPLAQKFGLYKAPAKPPISAGDWRKLKTAKRVEGKAKRIAQTAGFVCRTSKR